MPRQPRSTKSGLLPGSWKLPGSPAGASAGGRAQPGRRQVQEVPGSMATSNRAFTRFSAAAGKVSPMFATRSEAARSATSRSGAVLARRYRLESLIARGGMGEVWRGQDAVLGRPVAVKLMRSEFAGDPDTLARFRGEARHSAALSHPGIAHVYDYGESGPDGSPFIIMELISGPSLTELLAAGPLDPASVLDILAQAATALAAAHAAGLVHRDIKPGNILLAPGRIVKITDFGIAYAAGSVPLTRAGAVIGTPAYLAPERISGSPGTPASDLYALGMVAYECLAGRLPFTGTAVEITQAYAQRGLPPLPGTVPAPVAALVRCLTARDPAARPAAAEQAAAAARELRGALAAQGHQGGTAALAPLLPGALPAAGALAATGALPVTGARQATRAADPAARTQPPTLLDVSATAMDLPAAGQPAGPDQPRRRRRLLLAAAGLAVVIAGLGGGLIARQLAAGGAQVPAASRPAPTSTVPMVSTVNVDAPGLIGLPVQKAERQIQKLGLTVQVVDVPTEGQQPGTVSGVSPSGPVQPGSTVVLQEAVVPRHHHGGSGEGGSGDGGSGHGGGDNGSEH